MADTLETNFKTLNHLITFITVCTILGGAYIFWKNNIWTPNVQVSNVDYDKGVADININGLQRKLYAGSIVSLGGDWGIRFMGDAPYNLTLNRIEIYKDTLSYGIIDQRKGA